MKHVIHVNRHMIAVSAKSGIQLPVYTVKTDDGKARYGYGVKIDGPSEMVDVRVVHQLRCGARAWMTTDSDIEILGEMTFNEAQKLASFAKKQAGIGK